jgi:hypothetical protein
VHLSDTVEGHSVNLAIRADDLKGVGAICWERYFLKWDPDYPVLGPVMVAQLEMSSGKLGVPPDTAEQLVYWYHIVARAPALVSPRISGCFCRKVPKRQRIASARALARDELRLPVPDEARALALCKLARCAQAREVVGRPAWPVAAAGTLAGAAGMMDEPPVAAD